MSEAEPLAVVVGGGSGIGAALAEAYRARGTPTVTWDIAGSHDVTCDVTEPDEIDEAVGATRARWGVPTELTVTAGVGHAGLLADTDADEFDRVMRVNARGPWLCMRAWVGAMHASRRAGLARRGLECQRTAGRPQHGHLLRVKGGAVDVGAGGRGRMGELGLRVNAVAPGVTRTPMLGRGPSATTAGSPWLAAVAERTALGRLGEADDIAEAIMGLHAMEWVTGQVLECDGGLSLAQPDRRLG